MKAFITPAYGPADIVEMAELPTPDVGPRDVLIEVHATMVSAGDLRLRSADFPGFTAVPGRLMLGVLRPRAAVQGTMFAGRVVAVGEEVTEHAVGDDVFGASDHGAYAEFVCVPVDGALAAIPRGMSYEDAAQLPYGAATAYDFLVKLGDFEAGERLLIVGAAGGVGRFAVQIAKSLGAEVTAVASARSEALVRELGADHFIDYEVEDWRQNGKQYDVVFDIPGAATFSSSRSSLADNGRYLTLIASLGVLSAMAATAVVGGQRAITGVAMPGRDDLVRLAALAERGDVRPVTAARFPLDELAAAHNFAESQRPLGAVVVTVRPEQSARCAAAA